MKHVFVNNLPKDAKFIGKDVWEREHYNKGKYRYIVTNDNTIQRIKIK